jgi:hypothetical protein
MLRIVCVGRVATLIIAATVACSSRTDRRAQGRESSTIEATLERELGAHVGVPLRVRCVWIAPSCRATLPDGSHLGLRLSVTGGVLAWRLDGALVRAEDVEHYLRDALDDLGKPQAVWCGARVQNVAPDDRVQCHLQQGGMAFVVVHADGTTSTEIVLDAFAGEARAEPMTIERDSSLLEMSKKLEHADEEPEE